MWMLIRQLPAEDSPPRPHAEVRQLRATVPSGSPKRLRTVLSTSSVLAALGAASGGGAVHESGPVSVLLHPGRSALTQVSVDRVFDQFDCSDRAVYGSIEEAETRHAGDVGFLLQIDCPFIDQSGARRDRGVVFARSVRR
jgi:hypothetical protein